MPSSFRMSNAVLQGGEVWVAAGRAGERRAEAMQAIRLAQQNGEHFLFFRNYGLTSLPQEIFQLPHLRILNLAENRLSELSSEIGKLKQLVELNLSDNGLKNLPPEVSELSSLKKLNIADNQFEFVSDEIFELGELESLIFTNNKVTELPEKFSTLKKVDIYASGNPLSSMAIARLEAMEKERSIEDWRDTHALCFDKQARTFESAGYVDLLGRLINQPLSHEAIKRTEIRRALNAIAPFEQKNLNSLLSVNIQKTMTKGDPNKPFILLIGEDHTSVQAKILQAVVMLRAECALKNMFIEFDADDCKSALEDMHQLDRAGKLNVENIHATVNEARAKGESSLIQVLSASILCRAEKHKLNIVPIDRFHAVESLREEGMILSVKEKLAAGNGMLVVGLLHLPAMIEGLSQHANILSFATFSSEKKLAAILKYEIYAQKIDKILRNSEIIKMRVDTY